MKQPVLEPILNRIQHTCSVEQLRVIRDYVHKLLLENILLFPAIEFHFIVNRFHDAFIGRICCLAEKQLQDEGMNKPSASYAFILFGSGGRGEQTLWSDQDNGLIYDDCLGGSPDQLNAYFVRLSERIVHGLVKLGYPLCQGRVLASNPMWRMPFSGFNTVMLTRFENPSWEHIRYLLITADMRAIYGNASLVAKLKQQFFDYIQSHPSILPLMLSNTLYHKVALGCFGNLITERYGEEAGGVSIKYGAYIPLVNGIRLLAIQAGIQASSTLDRIFFLQEKSWIGVEAADEWKRAFIIALELRSITPYQLVEGLYSTKGKLFSNQLTKERRQQLKICLRSGLKLQKFVKRRWRI